MSQFNKNFLRILPPRLGDGLVSWVMGDSVVPAQLLKERQGAVRYSTQATDEDDEANGDNNNGEEEGEAVREREHQGRGGEAPVHQPALDVTEVPACCVPGVVVVCGMWYVVLQLRKCRQLYEVQDTLGEGAFAVVKLGVEKKTRQKASSSRQSAGWLAPRWGEELRAVVWLVWCGQPP